MNLTKEEIKVILEVFDDYCELMSELSKGSLFTEEWAVYNKLKEYDRTNNK